MHALPAGMDQRNDCLGEEVIVMLFSMIHHHEAAVQKHPSASMIGCR